MLLPVAGISEPGGSPAIPSRHFTDIVAVAPSLGTGLPDRHPPRPGAEGIGPAVEIASTAPASSADQRHVLSHRLARWEPVARAIGHASQAVIGFLRSVGVPQAQAEDVARRLAEAARERLAVERRATQEHFDSGRLSLKLEQVELGFGPDARRPEIRIGKAEIGVDVDIPGGRREASGATIGHTEAEIGSRHIPFDYKGPGATPAYADRGAAALSFDVSAPVLPSAGTTAAPASGPIDVAI